MLTFTYTGLFPSRLSKMFPDSSIFTLAPWNKYFIQIFLIFHIWFSNIKCLKAPPSSPSLPDFLYWFSDHDKLSILESISVLLLTTRVYQTAGTGALSTKLSSGALWAPTAHFGALLVPGQAPLWTPQSLDLSSGCWTWLIDDDDDENDDDNDYDFDQVPVETKPVAVKTTVAPVDRQHWSACVCLGMMIKMMLMMMMLMNMVISALHHIFQDQSWGFSRRSGGKANSAQCKTISIM